MVTDRAISTLPYSVFVDISMSKDGLVQVSQLPDNVSKDITSVVQTIAIDFEGVNEVQVCIMKNNVLNVEPSLLLQNSKLQKSQADGGKGKKQGVCCKKEPNSHTLREIQTNQPPESIATALYKWGACILSLRSP
jgi:transcriptional accessory protein Tex/SPT6